VPAFALSSVLAMLSLVTLIIKAIFEWQEGRRALRNREAEDSLAPVPVFAGETA